jgi:2-aminoadipate transaminase
MDLISFATGNTNPETFPTEGFAEAAKRAVSGLTVALNTYPGKLGHEGLRQLMAQREMDREGVTVDPNQILITNGSMQAITLAIEALCTGKDDVVVLEEYCYVGSIRYFETMGIAMEGVPLDEEGMRMDALDETLVRLEAEGRKPRCIYTLATYQNPTGAVMSAQRRHALIEIARRHDVPVIEDNCYGDVHYDGDKPPALYALDDDPRQIYLGSLSKIFAPGVRLGYVLARQPMLDRILARRNDAGPNTLASAITHEYLKDRLWEHIEMANEGLKAKRDTLLSSLHRHLGNECVVSRPAGGLFVWIRLPDDVDPGKLKEIAIEHGVDFAHGSDFHIHRNAGPYIRLAFGFPSIPEIEAGAERLGESLRAARGSSA